MPSSNLSPKSKIILELALDYNKYFNTNIGRWGLNTKFGIKGNITNNALSKSKVFLSNNRSVDMIVDNDKVLGYVNISGSYVLNTKDFDMEFSLAYYGNYGDRTMSNGGGFEWRVYWLFRFNYGAICVFGNHSADLANRHKARIQSPLSLCRFAKNYESTTAITSMVASLRSQILRIVIRCTNQSANNPSLRGV